MVIKDPVENCNNCYIFLTVSQDSHLRFYLVKSESEQQKTIKFEVERIVTFITFL